MRPLLALIAIMLIVSGVHALGTVQKSARDLAVKDLVARASAYVESYQQDFKFVVADESTEQNAHGPGAEISSRKTHGELFLTYLIAERMWLSVRDVKDVDGQVVVERDDLPALLRESPVRAVAEQLLRHNARYNLGNVVRNFNEPTIALLVLGRTHVSRFKFSRVAVNQHEPDETAVTLAFEERDRPTLVKGTGGKSVFSTGEVTIEPLSGRVHRTRILVRDGATTAELTTSFEWHGGVELWVPTLFEERYVAKRPRGDEVITSETWYSNYRRFQAEGRVR
ncbi:MAG: hypothetical protein ABI051_14435 [Vicinamibacterales bacterium]